MAATPITNKGVVCNENENVTSVQMTQDKICDLENKKLCSKSVNFFNSKERIPFPTLTNGNIVTKEFLDSASSFITIYDHLGIMFLLAKKEMANNVMKLRAIFEADPSQHKYLKHMLEKEMKNKKRQCASSLLWLKRALEFCCLIIQKLHQTRRETSTAECEFRVIAVAAYKETLYKHHGKRTRRALMLASQTLPTRATVFLRLNYNDASADVMTLLEGALLYVKPLPALLATVHNYFEELGLDTTEAAP